MRVLRRLATALAVSLLAACAGHGGGPARVAERPPAPALGSAVPAGGTAWSNASLARLLATLAHDMEWGASRPHLVRFERPVRVSLEGSGAEQYSGFLDRYLALLRDEAGIDISAAGEGAEVSVRFVPGRSFDRLLPSVSCIVAPGDIRWGDFRRDPERHGGDALAALPAARAFTVFIPSNAPPHLVRGCLLEEIAQALGPANDLYALGPSIFNDDAAHVWPTRLDLLMLRTLYAPELRTGMDRAETVAAARAALDRLNPEGREATDLAVPDERRLLAWRTGTQRIFARGTDGGERLDRALRALATAEAVAPGGAHHCHSLFVLGRVLRDTDPERALPALAEAGRVCALHHGEDDVRIARIRAEQGAALYHLGDAEEMLAATEGLDRVFAAHGQEDRLARLYALRSAGFRAIQRDVETRLTRGLARDWAAYALGAGGIAADGDDQRPARSRQQ